MLFHFLAQRFDHAGHGLQAQVQLGQQGLLQLVFKQRLPAAGVGLAQLCKARLEKVGHGGQQALFAPAEVWVSNLDSGRTWHGGGLNMDLLRRLWLEA
mgnify:CR=1 FL=1